jgi:hypothetical protein
MEATVISEPRWYHDSGPARAAGATPAFLIECRTCGFEPENQNSIFLGPCPKCFCSTWRRVPRPGGPLDPLDRAALYTKKRLGRTAADRRSTAKPHRVGASHD